MDSLPASIYGHLVLELLTRVTKLLAALVLLPTGMVFYRPLLEMTGFVKPVQQAVGAEVQSTGIILYGMALAVETPPAHAVLSTTPHGSAKTSHHPLETTLKLGRVVTRAKMMKMY
jgi:hypothetical protein